MKLIFSLSALLLCACPPTPAPAPSPPDASDGAAPALLVITGDLGTQVCLHLAAIGCPQPSTCASTLNTKQGVATDFHPACLLQAANTAQANLCGSIRCGDGG